MSALQSDPGIVAASDQFVRQGRADAKLVAEGNKDRERNLTARMGEVLILAGLRLLAEGKQP